MRILILGISGLIGHKLFQELSPFFELYGTLHKTKEHYGNKLLFSGSNVIENTDINCFEILKGIFYAINPDVILNCIGITKRKINSENIVDTLKINSLFPHELAHWAKINNKRIIHFSTDCVFDGKVGNYTENSQTTANDIYGRTKALGEINYDHTLTIRSSFIGQELFDKTELLDWFIAQDGKEIKGFKNTLYSGVSTIYMASVVKKIISEYPNLSGLYHLAPDKPISKYNLLCLAKEAFGLNIDIIPDEQHVNLPTLNASKLKREINLEIPSWKEMMKELAAKKEDYLNM